MHINYHKFKMSYSTKTVGRMETIMASTNTTNYYLPNQAISVTLRIPELFSSASFGHYRVSQMVYLEHLAPQLRSTGNSFFPIGFPILVPVLLALPIVRPALNHSSSPPRHPFSSPATVNLLGGIPFGNSITPPFLSSESTLHTSSTS